MRCKQTTPSNAMQQKKSFFYESISCKKQNQFDKAPLTRKNAIPVAKHPGYRARTKTELQKKHMTFLIRVNFKYHR